MSFVKDWFESNKMNAYFHEYHEKKVTGFKGKNIILELDGGEPGQRYALMGTLIQSNYVVDGQKNPMQGMLKVTGCME